MGSLLPTDASPPPATEAAILVAQADGKGEKVGRKKEAVVTSVYTIVPWVRERALLLLRGQTRAVIADLRALAGTASRKKTVRTVLRAPNKTTYTRP